jgi:hypothetical protein
VGLSSIFRLGVMPSKPVSLLNWQMMQDGVSPIRDSPGGVPDGVPGKIFVALRLAEIGVGLDGQGVDAELETPALVVEGIHHDADMIVQDEAVRIVAVHEVGPDLPGLGVEAPECDVEIMRVVGHQAFGPDRGRDVVPGLPFEREGDDRGRLPGLLFEASIHLDSGGRPPDLEPRRLDPLPVGFVGGRLGPDRSGRDERESQDRGGRKEATGPQSSVLPTLYRHGVLLLCMTLPPSQWLRR